jgi:putative nucleotidyltransferase with HDIG domain
VRCLVAAIDAKDKYTKGHSERVTFYALNVAREMRLTEKQTLEVYLAGLLHDIGKIGIEEKILNKKGALTQKEFDQVRLHPIRGVGIIRNIKNIDSIINAALHHHERFDGTGYPSGLKETGIPLASRLLAVADAYDAMTSDRPYRKRMTQKHAMREIQNHSGTQFSPEVADAFLQALTEKKIDMGDLEFVLDSHQKDLYKLWH